MLPVEQAGLHCGSNGCGHSGRPDLCSPSNRRGFIAASLHPNPCPMRGGAPVEQAGLHCGHADHRRPVLDRPVLPVEQAGLHCGFWCGVAPGIFTRCSPSNRRGFIAADPDYVCVMALERAPRRTGGASLRPQGSASALRPDVVLPVEQAGLHCGGDDAGVVGAGGGGAPRRTGGAPCGDNERLLRTGTPRAPRRTGGASLRPDHHDQGSPAVSVLPVEQAGLHCGASCSASLAVVSARAPRRTGGASLRPVGVALDHGDSRGAPRRTGGASLRLSGLDDGRRARAGAPRRTGGASLRR